MNENRLNTISIIGTAFPGLLLISWFLFSNPVADLVELTPGLDNRPADMSSVSEDVTIGAIYASFEGIPSDIQGSWPRFRDADFSNISREDTELADNWGEAGPNVLWSVDLGEGYAAPVVANGRVYLLDYDEEKRADLLRCFSFDDGREIWQRGYNVFVQRNHGMSRTVPAVNDNYVVTIGPMCHVMCLKADSGTLLWGIDLVKEYNAEIPKWYTGQCTLIDDSLVVIAVGGEALIMGVSIETGEVVWETPNPNNWKMSHSSIIPYTIHGREMYVYCALGGIVGISARGEDVGNILFETTLWNNNVTMPSPVYLGDGRLFVTTGYGAGSMILDIIFENDTYTIESVQAAKPREGIASELQTPILYEGHLFSILPNDAGPFRNRFVCYHPDDITELVWESGTTTRFGMGPYLIADGKFFILSDDGVLTVMRASTKEPVQLSQSKILNGHDAWGPMAIVQGRLLARDSRRLVCVDVRTIKE
ncbi:PQQ-binding-like beta-propeller repeat protein [candidate division KSB1 bacterium]